MKTILLLTDFSVNAEYTGYYALGLAQHLQANLLICNIYQGSEQQGVNDIRPFGRAEEDSISDLGAVVAGLKTRLDKGPFANSFRPDISQCSETGRVNEKLNELALKHDILLAVISAHSAHNFSGNFNKNHAWAIVDRACIPVLVIPYQVRFKPFKTIALASALHDTDMAVLESLTSLAKYSDAGLVVTHVGPQEAGEQQDVVVRQFFSSPASKINYPAIQYRHLKGRNITDSLTALTAQPEIDLLAVVHRRRGGLQALLNGSIARKLLKRPYCPLLIFPGAQGKDQQLIF